MKFGIDVGNGFTKFGEGMRFASKVRQGELTGITKGKKEVHSVKYGGKNYIVGEGNNFMGDNRYFDLPYKLSLLTAIALSSHRTTIEAEVVVGVPVDKYIKLAERMEEHFRNLDVEEIVVDDVFYRIEIKAFTVFTEGALPLKDKDDSHMVTIDVGAGTINFLEWEEQELVNQYTNMGGINEICQRVTQYLNENRGMSVKPDAIRKVLGEKTMYDEDGEVDISDTLPIITGYIDNVLSYVRTSFDFATCKYIKVFGGGAMATIGAWQHYFPKAQSEQQSQFVNQEVYKAIAEVLYEE